MQKEKVIVTGGAGFIGSHLVRALLDADYEVHVIDDYSGGKFPERLSEAATYHEGDVRDHALTDTVFQNAHYVFHLAARPRVQDSIDHPEETNAVNVDGTIAALEAARNAGVKRVMYSSSSAVYGDQEQMPVVETMATSPKSPYALQKNVGELYCRLYANIYGLETVSFRYFNVYGPQADPNGPYALAIAKFILQRKNNDPITIAGDGANTRDYVHVRDVARANVLAATSGRAGKGEVINIGAGKEWSVNEVAALIGGPVTHIEPRLEPKRICADTARAQQLLGWKPEISFEEGIAELKREAGLS